MAKKVNFKDLNTVKLNVVNTIEEAVKCTLGPLGRFVLVDQGYSSKMTKDGVTIAKAIDFKNPEENAFCSFFKTAATHTVDEAGDGTTTSIVLAANIFKAALKGISYGANSVQVKKGIEKAVKVSLEALKDLTLVVANDFEKIKQVAVVSANGDLEIGELITSAFKKIGQDGVITVEEGKTRDHQLIIVDGMQFDRGYISSYFSTNMEKMVAELDNPYILIYDKKISSIQSILGVLKAVNESGRSLLIIAEDIDGDAISTIILNKLKGVLKVVAVKAPGFGDRRQSICQDIAILTGGKYISEEAGDKLESITLADLGVAKRVVVTANETTIVEGMGNKNDINNRVAQIKNQIKEVSSEYDKEKLQERLAKLTGGVAILKVGGATEEAAKECKDRVDDAVQAVKAAIAEGIVPGGSVALLYTRKALKKEMKLIEGDEKIGFQAVYDAISVPLVTILENAGRKDAAVVLEKIDNAQANGDNNFGLDIRQNVFGDLVKNGVIDPVKVVRCALHNAASVAGMLLVCECSITNLPDDKESERGHGMMPGMPMM